MRAKILKPHIKNLREFTLTIWAHEETKKKQKKKCSKREYFHSILVYIIPCFEFHLEGIFSVMFKTSVKSASDILCSTAT